MEYEPGKIYRLKAPSDGWIEGQIVRFPVGLPVKFVEKGRDRFIVIEPKGQTVEFPLQYVWRLGRKDVNIFKTGYTEDPERYLLVAYESEEVAEKQWEKYTQPEKYRWYIDSLRKELGSTAYSDWECGWSKSDIKYILKAATMRFVINGQLQYPQEFIDAICDIALLIYGNDAPGWSEEVPPQVAEETAFVCLAAVEEVLTHHYFVQTEGEWNLLEKKFTHEDLEITTEEEEEE